MALSTPIAGIVYPQLSDIPNNQTAWQNMANAIDTQMVPRFASAAARDTAIPSPVEGMFHYRSDATEDRFYLRQAGAWVPMNFEKMIVKAATENRTATTSPTDDAELKFNMLGNAKYRFQFKLTITGNGSTANDFRMQLNPPTAPTAVTWGAVGLASSATANTSATTECIGLLPAGQGTNYDFGVGAAGTFMIVTGIVLNGATPGVLALKWSQTTSSATSTSILAGSTLRYQRVN